MKKLLNISVIAALAILPLAANATDYEVTDPTAANPATAASTGPGWALAQAGDNDGVLATAGYVKGAYNQTMKAINKLDTTKQNALDETQLSAIANVSTLDSRLTTAEGKITTAEGKISTLETTVGNSSSGLVKDVADNAAAITALQNASSNYATTTGAAATAAAAVNGATIDLSGIQATTASLTGSVPAVATWGTDALAANPVSVTLSQGTVVTGLIGNEANLSNKISAGTVSYTPGI